MGFLPMVLFLCLYYPSDYVFAVSQYLLWRFLLKMPLAAGRSIYLMTRSEVQSLILQILVQQLSFSQQIKENLLVLRHWILMLRLDWFERGAQNILLLHSIKIHLSYWDFR